MTAARNGRVRVWGPTVRIVHWGLVSFVTVAWATGHGPPRLHDAAGYAVLGLICLRLVRGVLGPPAERFACFLAGLRSTLRYTSEVLRGRERRFLGHNPLGGCMIVTLLMVALGAGLSGWLYTTDAFWGVAWVERLHGALADLLVVLIFVHVAGVLFTSFRQGENLIAAMVHGKKPRATHRHPEDAIDLPHPEDAVGP